MLRLNNDLFFDLGSMIVNFNRKVLADNVFL